MSAPEKLSKLNFNTKKQTVLFKCSSQSEHIGAKKNTGQEQNDYKKYSSIINVQNYFLFSAAIQKKSTVCPGYLVSVFFNFQQLKSQIFVLNIK